MISSTCALKYQIILSNVRADTQYVLSEPVLICLVLWILVAILLSTLVQLTQVAHAEGSSNGTLVEPEADAFVHDDILAFKPMMSSNPQMLEVGHSAKPNANEITYVRFLLKDIPRSDAFNDVTINSAVLTMLINDSVGRPGNYVVTAAVCRNNTWFEKNVTGYGGQPCPGLRAVKTLDSIIIRTSNLPSLGSWVVTNGVRDVLLHTTSAEPKITFKITAETTKLCLRCTGGYLKLFSRNASSFYFGAPIKLLVTWTQTDSTLKTDLITIVTVVLPIGAAVWGVAHWLYRHKSTPTPSS
jgi:hypothetical protein